MRDLPMCRLICSPCSQREQDGQCDHGGEGRSSGFFRSFGSRKELNERFVLLGFGLREMPRPSASSFLEFSK